MAHYELDARYLLCPMPVIKAQNMMQNLQHGDTLAIFATDPGAQYDLPCWCRINGHKLIACEDLQGEIHITVECNKA